MEQTNSTIENAELALEKALKKHFSGQTSLPSYDSYLYSKVSDRVSYEQQLSSLKPKLWAGVALFFSSILLLVFAFDVSFHAFAQTPISKYLSLIFTDFGLVTANWQDYSLSILENLPLGATAFLLTAFLAALWLLDFGAHQFSNFRKLHNPHHYGQVKIV